MRYTENHASSVVIVAALVAIMIMQRRSAVSRVGKRGVDQQAQALLEEHRAVAACARADGSLCRCLCLGAGGRRFAGGRGGVLENLGENARVHGGTYVG
jgi:hypothetical protein